MEKKRGFPALLLALVLALSLTPISAFAATSTVSNGTELKAALEKADYAEIKLGGNIETTETLDVKRTVTLDLNGYTLSCSSTKEDIIQVCSNGSLTIKDSGTGGKIDGQNKNCGFNVNGGTLTLDSGSIVNCKTSGDGGAVDVSNTSKTETPIKYGKFVMNGGAIMNCKAEDDGGAVDIGSGCTFIMEGGTISGCRADDDGGAVFIKESGAFELNGGVIENCSSGNNGGAVNIYENGSFTMTGGTIKDCKVDFGGCGNAVYGKSNKAIVAISGGTIENCGVYPWSFDEFTVTFDSDGGSAVAQQKVLNAPAVKPADPEKSGYDFVGWYLGNTQYAFDTNVASNITLKAHWTPTSASTAITAATIQNAKFDYKPGDAPQATAKRAANQYNYDILYECWQQFENNEPVAAWYSDNESHGSLPTIATFESGKSYVYSIMLKPKDGYSFSSETVITVNGQNVSAPFVGGSMYIPSIKTITPTEQSTPTTGGGYYYSPSTPTITALLTAKDAKSATDYSGGIYGLTFRSTASFSSFQGVQVDGKTLDKSNYIAEEGSIEVYLKAVYLQTLAAGKHTVTILSTEGNATAEFTIGGSSASPKTADPGVALYAAAALLSTAGLAWNSKRRGQ